MLQNQIKKLENLVHESNQICLQNSKNLSNITLQKDEEIKVIQSKYKDQIDKINDIYYESKKQNNKIKELSNFLNKLEEDNYVVYISLPWFIKEVQEDEKQNDSLDPQNFLKTLFTVEEYTQIKNTLKKAISHSHNCIIVTEVIELLNGDYKWTKDYNVIYNKSMDEDKLYEVPENYYNVSKFQQKIFDSIDSATEKNYSGPLSNLCITFKVRLDATAFYILKENSVK